MDTTTAGREQIEERLREACGLDTPWALVERFSTLVRLAGSEPEREAVAYVMGELDRFGVPYTLHTPVRYISWPLGATLRTLGGDPLVARPKTVSFSVSTGGVEREGDLVHLSTGYAEDATSLFDLGEVGDVDVRGKVVITEGIPIETKVAEITRRGAIAAIFAGQGTRIHEGICSDVWGSPDLESLRRYPAIPLLAINEPDGQALIERARRGGCRVALSTDVDTRWREIPVLVAEIQGATVPDEFVLVHGHLDSWHVGVGDNATGDATLLELARVFHQFRSQLARSIRIAWWSGHSQGRYAGSGWYADAFAIDLAENCVAHVNCDSPGCRWATEYRDVPWTEEAGPVATAAGRVATGEPVTRARASRAGDWSFNNLGLSGLFMLSSSMPESVRVEKGYYAVGGCGGNIEWHTEDDTLEIADRDVLLRDIRVYATAGWRLATAPVPELDFRLTLDEMGRTLTGYQVIAGERFDLGRADADLAALRADLDYFYRRLDEQDLTDAADPVARRASLVQRKLARILLPVHNARLGRFRQDPADVSPPLPELEVVRRLAAAEAGSDVAQAARISLERGLNRLIWALRRADEVVTGAGVVEA